jgi:type IV pilus assembly protein PilE
MKKTRGFTLIEVMVVVTIIGILVAIAFPSYQNYLRKGRRAQAQSYLMEVTNAQQQYLLDARSYAPDVTTLKKPTPTDVSNFYAIAIAVAGPPPSFTVTATPSGAQAVDGTLTIDSTGAKTRVVTSTAANETVGTHTW